MRLTIQSGVLLFGLIVSLLSPYPANATALPQVFELTFGSWQPSLGSYYLYDLGPYTPHQYSWEGNSPPELGNFRNNNIFYASVADWIPCDYLNLPSVREEYAELSALFGPSTWQIPPICDSVNKPVVTGIRPGDAILDKVVFSRGRTDITIEKIDLTVLSVPDASGPVTYDIIMFGILEGEDIPPIGFDKKVTGQGLQTYQFHRNPYGNGPSDMRIYTRNWANFTILSMSVTYAPIEVPLDVSVESITVSQEGAGQGPGGIQTVASGKPLKIKVPIRGSGFKTPETRTTSIALEAGPYKYSQRINLADIQSGQMTEATFDVTFDPSLTGTTQTIRAAIDPENVLEDVYRPNNTKSVQIKVDGASLNISKVQVSQAINDFILPGQLDTTLVQGKSTVVLATITATEGPLDLNTSITVTASLPDGKTSTGFVKLGDAITNDGKHNIAVLGPFVPQSSGTIFVTASGPSPMPMASPVPTQITVKPTNPLEIVYVPMESSCGVVSSTCAGYLRNPVEHIDQSTLFIQNSFPVADGQVKAQQTQRTQISQLTPGILFDLLNVWLARTLTNPSARNGIGIVPSDPNGSQNSGYFASHSFGPPGSLTYNVGTRGYTLGLAAEYQSTLSDVYPTVNPGVSLVEEDWWVVTAHEIAHTFGILDNKATDGSIYATGYDIVNNRAITSNPLRGEYFYDFMSDKAPTQLFRNLGQSWISASTYGTVFQALLTDLVDPQVIVLAGMQQQDGSIELSSAYFLSNGISTPFVDTANNAVNVLDSQGEVISRASFADASQLQLISDGGVRSPLLAAPFVIQVHFPEESSTIQILHQGTPILTFDPYSTLLADAIKAIPQNGFVQSPIQMKDALLNKVASFSQILATGSKEAASNKLKNDIRKSVTRWVLENYTVSSPLQLKRSQILGTIDQIILHLQK